MFVPSLKAAKITIQLLGEYENNETLEKALKSNYDFRTPEDFLREHFAQHNYATELEDEVTEFFFRISKYRKYLEVIEKEIINRKPSLAGRSNEESSINLVFLYLLIIELNEFSKPKVEELMMTISEKKTMTLLAVLRKSDFIAKLYEFGCRIWDIEYVKDILQNVLTKPLFQDVYESVASQQKKSQQSKKKELTVPIGPKCANVPKKFYSPSETVICPAAPMTRIPIMIRANGIPSSTYERPIQLEAIEKLRRFHREQAQKKYQEAQINAFRCANMEKPEICKKFCEETQRENLSLPVKKLSWNKIKSKEVHPKKTAAVILREGARLLKLEQEEIKRFEDLARGGFNNDLLAEWEKEIREETFQKHMEDIEKKHLEGLLSYEEALIAKQKLLKKKKESVTEFKKEKENWLNQLEMWRKEEQRRIQESFEKGKAYEKGAKEAVEHAREEKHKIGADREHLGDCLLQESCLLACYKAAARKKQSHYNIHALETMEESRALKERWLREKEEDLQRKVQLIKEIKALQALGVIRRKQTDFTETANLGFLYEMSLAELKERLFILKIEVQEELERRRAEVKMKRECRKEIINSYQELIESHQKILQEKKQKPESDCENMEIKKKTKLSRSSSSLDGLKRKLYEKRRERITHQIM